MRIVGGKHKRRPLKALPSKDIRPTSDRAREAIFNVLEHGIHDFAIDGAVALDIFAGTGALGLEALSRGAKHACFINSDPRAIKCIRENAGQVGEARNVTILKLDAVNLPPPPLAAQAPCNLVFLDPPYQSGLDKSNLAADALQSLRAQAWIGAGSLCIVEVPAKEPFSPPKDFEELDRRNYGAAQVVFLKL